MVAKTSLALLWALLWAQHCLAQADTLAPLLLREVEVVGQIPEAFLAGSKVQKLDSLSRQLPGFRTLGQLLQALSSLYVREYGAQQLSSLSFRGTGSSHTAVLWQGININSPTLGMSDLGTLPVFGPDQIQLQYGAASALYGSDAVGGSILLQESPPKPGFGGGAFVEMGSFGHYAHGGQLRYAPRRGFSGQSKWYYAYSENDFPYRDFQGRRQTQNQARVKYGGWMQQLNYRFGTRTILSLNAWFHQNDRQIQPVINNFQADESLFDQSLRVVADFQTQFRLHHFLAKLAYVGDQQTYLDGTARSTFRARKYVGLLEYERQWGTRWQFRAGADVYHTQGQSLNLGGDVYENRYAGFASGRGQLRPFWNMSLSLRQTWVDGFTAPFVPSWGNVWRIWQSPKHQLQIKSLAARSFRIPTLNDRYWQPGGNLELRPEQGWNLEGGLQYRFQKNAWHIESELTHYRLWVEDWIFWRPTENGYWSPENLRTVRGQGFELSGNGHWSPGPWQVRLQVQMAYTRSEEISEALPPRQLPYVPRWRAGGFLHLQRKQAWLRLQSQYTSLRYETLDNRVGPASSVPAFQLWGLAAGYSWAFGERQALHLSLQVENLLNTAYQNYLFRAMPGRSFQLRLQYTFSAHP